MWADLKRFVAAALRDALTDVAVTAHADAEIPTVDAVRVMRGATAGRPLYGRPVGEQELALEVWTTDADPAVADERLQALENRVLAALETVSRDGPILKIEALGTDPDDDLFRPTVGCRMNLRVHWRQRRS